MFRKFWSHSPVGLGIAEQPIPPPFVPTDIGGCVLWLRSDLGITKDASDRVSEWADQSGNGLTVSQATDTAKPVFYSNQINGHAGIYFDGVDDFLSKAAVARSQIFPNIDEGSFVLIIKTVEGCTPFGWAGKLGDSSIQILTHMPFGDIIYFDFPYNAGQGRSSASEPSGWNNTWHSVILVRRPDGTQIIRADKTTLNTSNRTGTAADVIDPLYIGKYFNGLNFKGYLAEMLVYKVGLTGDDITSLESYFNSRYGL